jgi:ATP synthase F1 delta subunit
MPSISISEKKKICDLLLRECNAEDSLYNLIYKLIEDGRVEIIVEVLKSLLFEYNKRHGLESFTVSSSHELTVEQKETLITFIKSMTSSTPEVAFSIDQSLIVGLRIQSDCSLWERSIKKELVEMSTTLVRRGMPC